MVEEVPIALIASKIKERTGIEHKTIRKSLNSLNMTPGDAPERARIGKRSDRVIWFIPEKLEKHLREFVIDYEINQLYKDLGLPVPHVPDVPRSTPPWSSGRDIKNTTLETSMGGNNVEQVEHLEQNGLDGDKKPTLSGELIEAIRFETNVGELWPRLFLEERGIDRETAENIVEGLRQAGKLEQSKGKSWRVVD